MPASVYERLQLGVAILNALTNRRARTGNDMLHRDLEHKIIQRELDDLQRESMAHNRPKKGMVDGPGCIFQGFSYKKRRMNFSASHDVEIQEPNWAPLEQRIGSRCAEFMWMYARDGIEFYKHIATRRYLCLNSQGEAFHCIQGDLQPVEFAHAYGVVTRSEDGPPGARPEAETDA